MLPSGKQGKRGRGGSRVKADLLSEMNPSWELSAVISCASPGEDDPWTFTFIGETCHQN